MLVQYKGSQFLFGSPNYKKECLVDQDFVTSLDKINSIALKYDIWLYITSSFRENSEHIRGAVVTPASKSNHFVGHAIDFNLFSYKKLYTSKELSDPQGNILSFINDCKKEGIRWGGDFSKKDPIHFDDGLNIKDPKRWEEKYKEYHK